MAFSDNLIRLRKEQNLNQEQLAEKLGVSRQAVSKWETDEALPDLQKALLLAETLGVSLDSLCGIEELSEAHTLAEPAPCPAKNRKRHILFASLATAFLVAIGLLLGALFFLPFEGSSAPETDTEEVLSFLPHGGSSAPETKTVEVPLFRAFSYEFTEKTVIISFRANTQDANTYSYTLLLYDGSEVGKGPENAAVSANADDKDGIFIAELPVTPNAKYSLSITAYTPYGPVTYDVANELFNNISVNGSAGVFTD